ncbi:MAG TPA: hemerythrin domain-containing protein [Candidatus Sulfotelmatobacter sp.]|nr:hemerythrin domain-containing protein [Candidatus Sulfotelmatobacter sp.]
MLRNKNLIPLSHQHQRALALCVRIDRASPILDKDLPAWQQEISQHFRNEIEVHFRAEEQVVFPVASQHPELRPLIEELLADHSALRASFADADAGSMPTEALTAFAHRLSEHIRKEERRLFERLQALLSHDELFVLGEHLAKALSAAPNACVLPDETTRLRARK